jgi:hypothetical protein
MYGYREGRYDILGNHIVGDPPDNIIAAMLIQPSFGKPLRLGSLTVQMFDLLV